MSGIQSWLEYMGDNRDEIQELTIEHAVLVIQVMVAAIVVAVAVGILVHKRPALRNLSLSIASVFLTIPSLSLFTLFIPIFGIGKWPPRVALFMYALLPILRNTVTGLDSVDPAVDESAKGMGMGNTRRMLQVKLPLAWPVIITGIRVSTLLVTGIAAIATLVNGGGLGDLIKQGFGRLGLPGSLEAVWAGTVMVVALALVLDLFFVILKTIFSPRILSMSADLPGVVTSWFGSSRSPATADSETIDA